MGFTGEHGVCGGDSSGRKCLSDASVEMADPIGAERQPRRRKRTRNCVTGSEVTVTVADATVTTPVTHRDERALNISHAWANR